MAKWDSLVPSFRAKAIASPPHRHGEIAPGDSYPVSIARVRAADWREVITLRKQLNVFVILTWLDTNLDSGDFWVSEYLRGQAGTMTERFHDSTCVHHWH
jgi:hypothetical protein